MAEEDQSRRWLQKDRVAEWSKQWYVTHGEEIRERDRQKTRLKKLIPHLHEIGVLTDDDLLTIQRQRESRLPLSKTISFIDDRVGAGQESWNRDEVSGATHEKRTFKMFLSHLHEAGTLDDNDLRVIAHQRKAHLRRYETISYVGDRIRVAQQSRNGPTPQSSQTISSDFYASSHRGHSFDSLENEVTDEPPDQGDLFEEDTVGDGEQTDF
jgi:hypothetical protein